MQTSMLKGRMQDLQRALATSGMESIDALLERRPVLAEDGRVAIAWVLLRAQLGAFDTPGQLTKEWHQWLFKHIERDIDKAAEKVSFVTFNYDETLELALTTMFMNGRGMSYQAAIECVERFTITHVYGKLHVELPWSSLRSVAHQSVRGYLDLDACVRASKGLFVLNSERLESASAQAFGVANNQLRSAKHIVFLGYGFDRVNTSRLLQHDTTEWHRGDAHRVVHATAYRLLKAERQRAQSLISLTPDRVILGGPDQGCLEFLRDVVDWDLV